MRICIVAEHASTRFGGEAILPIHYFRLLRARGIEAWLVVHARTRDELAELFPEDMGRIRFVPDLWIHRTLYSLCCRLPRRLSEATLGLLNQLITQFCQRSLIRDLVREEGVEIVHQPIPVSPRFPSALYGLGVPVVIGPLNGGMEYPPAFHQTEPWISRAAVALAKLFVDMANTLIPGKRQADVVLVANERTRLALPPGVRGKVIELVENGIDAEMWHSTNLSLDSERFRFVFLGRMVDWKRVDIVIRALAQVPMAELEIIGDGPMSEPNRALAQELGVKDRVIFAGWVPQQECPVRLQSALALVLPSIYECGGAVVLEAMAMGKPVIATRWGGPADYLDESCGILVDPDSEAGMVAGFADAMQQLIHSPGLARAMGSAGRQRALRDFDWRPKIDYILGIYRSLIPGEATSTDVQDEEATAIAGSERG
jgi:glycosyltransferase involved in cell wall biosynthesis